ncbi:hypothetical protein ACFVHS_25020 [Streptomyces sp. NPDC057746]|uniref:hypothetical protein n=1 Tax=Streptomyces sp. NPDC057746 TaxID=3346237 RepID=UPI0036B2750E
MEDVLLAGVLGAAVLAIVLLQRTSKKHAQLLAELKAEATAAKIARLAQQQAPISVPELDEDEAAEPVRRKRHLALYIGGGVAAVLASLGKRLKSAPRAVAAATAVSVAVATTAAAFYIKHDGHDNVPLPVPHRVPPATAPAYQDAEDETPAADAPEGITVNRADSIPAWIDPNAPSATSTDHPAPSPDESSTHAPDPEHTPGSTAPAAPPQPLSSATSTKPVAPPKSPTPMASPAKGKRGIRICLVLFCLG